MSQLHDAHVLTRPWRTAFDRVRITRVQCSIPQVRTFYCVRAVWAQLTEQNSTKHPTKYKADGMPRYCAGLTYGTGVRGTCERWKLDLGTAKGQMETEKKAFQADSNFRGC
jgi:hypothetical protein